MFKYQSFSQVLSFKHVCGVYPKFVTRGIAAAQCTHSRGQCLNVYVHPGKIHIPPERSLNPRGQDMQEYTNDTCALREVVEAAGGMQQLRVEAVMLTSLTSIEPLLSEVRKYL